MTAPDIIFPHLGIEIQKMHSVAFTIFGLEIYWYALFIGTAFLAGLGMASHVAKKTNQDTEQYADFLMYTIIAAIIGARLYYVAFAWDQYKDDLWSIFNIRSGGLAIYGGVIASVLALVIYTRVKKLDFKVMADTSVTGLILGQAIGRLGNFTNMEAFGGYTDNVFAMAIKATSAKYIPTGMETIVINGADYIQVHPTFLYEALWGIGVLIILLNYRKIQRFDGEVTLLYFLGYGAGRSWIEGLRTDQLQIGNSGIAVSQVLAIITAVVAAIWILIGRRRSKITQK